MRNAQPVRENSASRRQTRPPGAGLAAGLAARCRRHRATWPTAWRVAWRVARRTALPAAAAFVLAQPCAWAAVRFGTAVVEKGEMTIVRDGRMLAYPASPALVPVNEKDLVRVREASRVVLLTREKVTLTLGANAVFDCEPWETARQRGVFRMLFGRFRADAQALAGINFTVKTATATVGVKGTAYSLAQTSSGNTAVLGIESTVTTAGADGVEQPVGPNQVSAVVGNRPATASVVAPEEFKQEMAKIDSPPPASPEALELPAEAVLVDQGIVSKEALEESKLAAPVVPPVGAPPAVPFRSLNLDDAGLR